MGAWGYGLFEGDHDWQLIEELDEQVGILELIKKAEAKLEAEGKSKTDARGGPVIMYTMFGDLCNDIPLVREHLETTGALQKLIDKLTTKFHASKSMLALDSFDIWYGAEYKLVILAALAMSSGCKLPPDFKKLVGKLYPYVGLMSKGLKQMKEALEQYREGTPYELGSHLSPIEAHEERVANGTWDGGRMMNVWGVATMCGNPPEPESHPGDACGCCGSKGDEEHPLSVCGKCHKRKYCDADCQKIHWNMHKKRCKKNRVGNGKKANAE